MSFTLRYISEDPKADNYQICFTHSRQMSPRTHGFFIIIQGGEGESIIQTRMFSVCVCLSVWIPNIIDYRLIWLRDRFETMPIKISDIDYIHLPIHFVAKWLGISSFRALVPALLPDWHSDVYTSTSLPRVDVISADRLNLLVRIWPVRMGQVVELLASSTYVWGETISLVTHVFAEINFP